MFLGQKKLSWKETSCYEDELVKRRKLLRKIEINTSWGKKRGRDNVRRGVSDDRVDELLEERFVAKAPVYLLGKSSQSGVLLWRAKKNILCEKCHVLIKPSEDFFSAHVHGGTVDQHATCYGCATYGATTEAKSGTQ